MRLVRFWGVKLPIPFLLRLFSLYVLFQFAAGYDILPSLTALEKQNP